jgi:hypothetical protein
LYGKAADDGLFAPLPEVPMAAQAEGASSRQNPRLTYRYTRSLLAPPASRPMATLLSART